MKKRALFFALLLSAAIAACGGGGGGSEESDPYLGVYFFRYAYQGTSYEQVYDINAKTTEKTSDGETIYTGKGVSDPNYSIVLAYSPDDNAVIAFTDDPYNFGAIYVYAFTIDGSNLKGQVCARRTSDGVITHCVDLTNSVKK